MGYFKDTLKGIGWMTGLRGVVRGLSVVKIAVLARILSPSQFGVYGIALLILGLLEVLTETGINVFLIQEKDGTEEYLDSAWAVSIIRGTLIAILILAAVPMTVWFFKSPEVTPLLYLVAGVAFVRGFINPMAVQFQKTLQFKKEFFFQSALFFVDAAVAIVLGHITKSESAMISGMLAAAGVEVILSFVIFKQKPKLKLDIIKVKKVINAGKWITGAGIFSYFFQNIDNLVVGRLLGTTSLGFYQQAYRISTLPVSEVGQIFNKVTFPVFVKISDERERLKKAYQKTLLMVLGLVLPFGIIVALFSKPIILLLLGPSWLPAEPALKVLAIFGVLKSLLNSTYSLFLSVKLQKIVMFSELAGIIGIIILVFPLTSSYGTLGASYAALFGSLLSLPVIFFNYRKIFR
ncbi:MAG: Membrane protein involved in the export of O-antigen and teichoic acid [Candidatus Woesebacteria bacterium GW2011_GWB1_45_5]|uniref:Membrane protein involved in the export of O-antigen and teichoic acid n=1 Tax=Candidatus Woesebacteria bacterium GW2011_GWB1_45_5 TaxID=1618581 RepID=A0A0G1MLJ6_9BACT|nr:MAG: Membrane protein involved in the export of O-antigen and teichoic acid [Candidatus Woesebacteria bacterium GW2011_GWB1_45_5]